MLEAATPADAEAIAGLRNAAADDLTARHGRGPGSGHCSAAGVRLDLRRARVFVVRRDGAIVASLVLGTRKPWSIDRKYFTAGLRPAYLTAMVVTPACQRQGLGRAMLAAVDALAAALPADVLCLDAYDVASGAGEFYRRCGFREVGRAAYRGTPLRYFERLLAPPAP